jgi:hypothetical protein
MKNKPLRRGVEVNRNVSFDRIAMFSLSAACVEFVCLCPKQYSVMSLLTSMLEDCFIYRIETRENKIYKKTCLNWKLNLLNT